MTLEQFLIELRAWRDEFARSHGYDIAAMAATLQKMNVTEGRQVVRGEPRRPAGYLSAKPTEAEQENRKNAEVA